MMVWQNVAVIGLGAAVGAWLRWLLGLLLNPLFAPISLGTVASNLIGGYLVGVALAFIDAWPELSPALRLLMITGFLGGLTTFSSFSGEVFFMLQRQAYAWAALTIFAHVAGSLLMTALGWFTYQAIRPHI